MDRCTAQDYRGTFPVDSGIHEPVNIPPELRFRHRAPQRKLVLDV